MLNERGAKCEGSLEFPTKEQLDKTDVLILHAQEAGISRSATSGRI